MRLKDFALLTVQDLKPAKEANRVVCSTIELTIISVIFTFDIKYYVHKKSIKCIKKLKTDIAGIGIDFDPHLGWMMVNRMLTFLMHFLPNLFWKI